MAMVQKLLMRQDAPSRRDHFANRWQYETEIGGQTIKYVLAPQNLLDDHGQGTRLGYQDHETDREGSDESGTVFVAKSINPAAVPFAAFFAHYKGAEIDELEDLFGAETVARYGDEERYSLVVATTLKLAGPYLRPEQMADLINRMREEPGYISGHEVIFSDAVGKVYASGSPSQALVALSDRQARVLDHYADKIGDAVRAHGKNARVRLSKGVAGLTGSLGALLQDAYMTRCEPSFAAIMEEGRFTDALPGVMDFLEQMAGLPKGTEFAVSADEGALLYRCSGDYVSGNPPVEFTGNNDADGREIVRLRKKHASFWPALVKRLQGEVLRDLDEAKGYLEGVEDLRALVARIDAPTVSRIAAEARRLYLPASTEEVEEVASPNAMAKPVTPADTALATTVVEETAEGLGTHVIDLSELLTRAPARARDLRRLAQAHGLLAGVQGMEAESSGVATRLDHLVGEEHRVVLELAGIGSGAPQLPAAQPRV